ncbi:MAG: glycosyltransferase [Sulfitobacter sp.]
MSTQRLLLSAPRAARRVGTPVPLGRYLVDADVIGNDDLIHALNLQRHVDAPLGEILISEGLADREDVLIALSEQHFAQLVNLERDPPTVASSDRLPVNLCLQYRAVAWMDMAGILLVATSRPDQFDALRKALGDRVQPILPVIADEEQIKAQISQIYGAELAYGAITRVPAALSCRNREVAGKALKLLGPMVLGLTVIALIMAPLWTMTIATVLAFVTLIMTTLLKASALCAQIMHRLPENSVRPDPAASLPFRLPRVSVLVPLFNEKEIASALIVRLARLTYPKSLLEVVLVLEAKDNVTRQSLEETELPPWISVIEVPEAGQLTTKPRALNFALDFCKGSIIGVWDAEDAPEPDQIERVVSRFQTAPDNVACLQGILDYYNAPTNWLTRCFTIEYASWWRIILPGIARLGLVIPLGGTTLFFRRNVLEKLYGWDAHNVTEDADLGVRLAREGYVTELLPTVTYEEATSRYWPWVRQRSRWLKGFLITWCVHMRNPRRLLADLGPLRFLGVQTMLFATFVQFAAAPLLWSFWLISLGGIHPVEATLGAYVMWSMIGFFVLSELLNLGLSVVAVSGQRHQHLLWWVITMPFYFTLGAVAAMKALYEFFTSPYFWDKTEHGVAPGHGSGDRSWRS